VAIPLEIEIETVCPGVTAISPKAQPPPPPAVAPLESAPAPKA
jgi:hypothetical protein